MRSVRRRATRIWIAGALALLTAAAYERVRECGFLAYDDDKFVTAHPHVARGWTAGGLRWALAADLVFDSPRADYWEPLVVLSRMTDVELYGMRPRGHHLTNLALHVASVVLVFLVLQALTGARWKSAAVAALFAVHPQHVESVAWVSERKDVLSGFLFLLTLAAYTGYVRSPSLVRRALVALALALGLMAKPMLTTVPFVLLLLDVWPLSRVSRGLSTLLAEKTELFLLSAASIAISLRTMAPLSAEGSSFSLAARLANALAAYGGYLRQAFWPTGLAIGYPHAGEAAVAGALASAAALVAVSVVAIRERARRPFLLVGWCWFLGMLVPVIGLVQVGVQSRADRYVYLPLIGISVAVVWLLGEVACGGTLQRRLVASAVALAVLLCSGLSWRQVGYWRDDLTLFSHAVQVLPESPIAHAGLAAAWAQRGRLDLAESELRLALRLGPALVVVRRALASLAAQRGRLDQAVLVLEDWLRLVPATGLAASELRVALGALLAPAGHAAEAEAHYAAAVRAFPRQWAALYDWGNLLAAQGRLGEAEEKLRAARRINPDDAAIANNLGIVLLLEGRADASSVVLAGALDWFPADARLLTSFGRALLAQGRTEQALRHLRAGVAGAPQSADAHFQLASGLETTARFDEAQAEYATAVRLDPRDAQAAAALARIRAARAAGR